MNDRHLNMLVISLVLRTLSDDSEPDILDHLHKPVIALIGHFRLFVEMLLRF